MDIARKFLPFPGRTTDFNSAGCNWLIRNNQASLLENAQDLVRMMGWEEKNRLLQKTPGGSYSSCSLKWNNGLWTS